MTLSEFKAWLEGFSASFVDGAPSRGQWAVIENKLSKVMTLRIEPSAPVKRLPPLGTPWLEDAMPKVRYSH